MALGKKPTAFVSSTCYDLGQIRNDIRAFFIDQLGYDVLLSEYDSFPLDPNISAVDNCLRAVDERADIFVLIVGCRYGSVTETGHSVTNLEYLRAKSKGIPIYAFVDKKILSALPFWRDNLNGNFQSTVDTPKLFEFVDEFREKDQIWSFGFESAQEIVGTLKSQLGYLFSDCLSLRYRATHQTMTAKVRKLEGTAFQTALLRPTAWEYKLFAQVLADGLNGLTDYRRDFKFGITFSPTRNLQSFDEVMNYISLKTEQLQRAIDIISTLIYKTFPEAIGKQGEDGDADYIIYTANRLVEVYASIIDWSLDFRSIMAENEFSGLVNSFFNMCEGTLCDIEKFSKEYSTIMESIPTYIPEGSESISLEVTLTLSPPNLEDYYREINILRQKYGLEPVSDDSMMV